MKAIAFFDGARGRLALYDHVRGATELITTLAHLGQKIQIDDGKTYPELCEGGGKSGRPLEWSLDIKHLGHDFARGCGARLYKKREGYEGAFERMRADADFGISALCLRDAHCLPTASSTFKRTDPSTSPTAGNWP